MYKQLRILLLSLFLCVGCSSVNTPKTDNPQSSSIQTEQSDNTAQNTAAVFEHSKQQLTGFKLNNGLVMPQPGLGTYQLPEGEVAENAVLEALKQGYRHIDTAHAYRNERSVGRAIRKSGIQRQEIWVTSKLWPNEYGEGKTLPQIDKMLKRLDLDYIDLVYLHQPVGDYIGAIKELAKAVELGKIRAFGISNFDFNDEMYDEVTAIGIKPAAMQIECHPYAQRKHWQEKLKKDNILLECWFPLGGRDSNGEILRDPIINKIAVAHNKTPAQVILRWHYQEGFSLIPGSQNPQHIAENIAISDFVLSDNEMNQIRSLDKEHRYFTMTYDEIHDRFLNFVIDD